MGVLLNGLDHDVFHPEGRVGSSRLLVTFVGQLARFKGVDLMLEAVAKSQAKDALVRVVGSTSHMPGQELSA